MPPELSRWLRNSAAAHSAILAGLWALFFWRYFAAPPNQVVFPDGDFTQQFFVFRSLAFRELAAGRLPLGPTVSLAAIHSMPTRSAAVLPAGVAKLWLAAPAGLRPLSAAGADR